MELTERERWLLNFYRNSELHGALLMGRLARTVGDNTLLIETTAHWRRAFRARSLQTRPDAVARP